MSLQSYRKKRNFARTPEPTDTGTSSKSKPRFVIQKHDATRLHYDFRLEMGGTLLSWAVPKGLPLNHGEKKLAVKVEDHPLSYAEFEGIIPAGEYGGGTVMVWDEGTYSPVGNSPAKDLRGGKLHVILTGRKLTGEWYLVRLKGEDDQWLIIRGGDDHPAIPKKIADRSVLSGSTMAQLARGKTNAPEKKAPARNVLPVPGPASKNRSGPSSKSRSVPWLAPMMAKLVDSPPAGAWEYEIKLDGFRGMAFKQPGDVAIFSRTRQDLTPEFPEIAEALAVLKVDEAVIDGEIVALDPEGRPSFQLLQNCKQGTVKPPLCFYAFDLLRVDGKCLLDWPLEKRKARLEQLIPASNGVLRFSPSLGRNAAEILKMIRSHQLEGMIGKRAGSVYEPGKRTGTWIKCKVVTEQEFVIGGYTDPMGNRSGFGALLVGYYGQGKLCYSGKVGTGFTRANLATLLKEMKAVAAPKCPFDPPPEAERGRYGQGLTAAALKACHWLKPRLVAQVKFSEWTRDGRLRHPVFMGLRRDKPAAEVLRENVPPAMSVKQKSARTQGKTVPVTHPDKVFYPKTGFTKKEVVDFYRNIAPVLLPHLEGRAITLKRYPDGVEGNFFYEKQCPSHAPPWIRTTAVKKSDGTVIDYCLLDDLPSLLWAVNLANLEFHPFLHRWNAPTRPAALVFDLDPGPPADILQCGQVAVWIRDLLARLDLISYIKTSGSKGLQLIIPLNNRSTYARTKPFAKAVAAAMATQFPDVVTDNMKKSLRDGKVLIDWSQNDSKKTTVSAYSLRARDVPSVSTPITWDELESAIQKKSAKRLVFLTRDVLKRVSRQGDLLADALTLQQTLPAAGIFPE